MTLTRAIPITTGCVLLAVTTSCAYRACRAEHEQPPAMTPTSGKTLTVRPNHDNSLGVAEQGFGFTLKPGDCESGTGPAALEQKPDTGARRPPCVPTPQYRKRLDALRSKGSTP